MNESLIAEGRDMAVKNPILKKTYVENGMQNDLLKEALEKSVKTVSETRNDF
jgi:hypothetical protein